MKILVVLGVIAAALAHPLPDDCDKHVLVAGALPHAHHPLVYAGAAPVHLAPAEVHIPVTQTHVEVPVHKQVHYGTQAYVAGSHTAIHKPSLTAPAIAPPSTLLSKITYKAPEITIKKQEVKVEKHTPNYVETPYHAGTITKYTAPQVKQIDVPTPYAVPHPVAHPVAVPHPVPVAVATPVHQYAAVSHAVAPAGVQAVQYGGLGGYHHGVGPVVQYGGAYSHAGAHQAVQYGGGYSHAGAHQAVQYGGAYSHAVAPAAVQYGGGYAPFPAVQYAVAADDDC